MLEQSGMVNRVFTLCARQWRSLQEFSVLDDKADISRHFQPGSTRTGHTTEVQQQ